MKTAGAYRSSGRLRRFLDGRSDVRLAAILFVILLAVNIWLNPARFSPADLGTVIGLASPLMLAAVAVMVPFLAGRGSIDVSVGPAMGLINVIVIVFLLMNGISTPWLIVPAILLMGLASGLINGFLSAYVRIQPIVATLGTYLFYSGLALTILPSPAGSVPDWLRALSGAWSPIVIGAAALIWLGIKRLPYYQQLMAVGGDDRAAFTAGIDVSLVRLIAYVIGGLFTSLAALSLTALIGSGDPSIGPSYTLIAIAAAALGGVNLAGGLGGFTAAALGAADIFLIQSVLTYFNVSTFVLQLAYGIILVVAVCLNSDVVKLYFSYARRQP
mgnify:CR=1 FL=1